jgi:hypothetical protein
MQEKEVNKILGEAFKKGIFVRPNLQANGTFKIEVEAGGKIKEFKTIVKKDDLNDSILKTYKHYLAKI